MTRNPKAITGGTKLVPMLRMLHFNRQIHTCYHNIFLLNKICDGGSSKEPFLKATTLSILIWANPREMKTNDGNFKNAATRDEHAHSFCRCVRSPSLSALVLRNI